MDLDEDHKIILDILSKYGELNITKIVRYTGLHFRTVTRKLKDLVINGYVEERRYGRLRLYRIKGKPWGSIVY